MLGSVQKPLIHSHKYLVGMYFALSIDVGAGNSMKKLAAGAPALTQLTWQGVELEA